MNTIITPLEGEIQKLVLQNIKNHFEIMFEEEKEKFIQKLDDKKDELLASIVLQMSKCIDLTYGTDVITIRLKTESLINKNE